MADADAQPPSSTEPVLVNGHNHESPAPPTPTLPAVPSSQTAVDALAAPSLTNNTTNEHDDDDKPPPAKRARKYSDAERASLANTGTPPPASPSDQETALPAASSSRPTPMLSLAQWRFCTSTIRTLKKLKDAGPFLHPVDPVALNIPHYPSIVKHPMDFSTIDRKMASSNPAKPDPNASNPRYNNADEFIVDVRLIFHNCILFNGPDHPITAMGKRVEAVFEKQIKQMPPPGEVMFDPQVVKKVATPPPPPPPPAKKPAARRPSTSVPVIRRSEDHINGGGRPKREIHPPPPKDLPYTDAPKKMRKAKTPKNNAYVDQFKFCEKILRDVHKKSYYTIAHPFYEPVDWVKLDIPQYPKIIKKPMDLSTIRRKLQDGEYSTPEKFREDFKLMVKNSLMFNPPKNPVHEAGKELDRIFDEKWKQLPPLRSQDMSDDEDDDEDDDTDDERSRTYHNTSSPGRFVLNDAIGMIANIESQIQHMRNNLDTLKRKAKPEKKEKKKKEKVAGPVASTSKAPKTAATKSIPPRKKGKKPITDDDVLTFEQKKELSDTIGKLDGVKLERVIQIIHEGVPEIRDSTEEIELEIDQLPASVLQKLYNFVIRPIKASVPKRARTGKGTGTGGLKRKSMDEDVEAAKIRALEERMKLFEGGREPAGPANEVPAHDDSEHSSNESSSESSGSDSE
ncbi:Bromodomain-containing protein [Wolfiporia cocos MD-104 SS10]|uniref:Bromodomain-containing protein n=1 Tax=Wolfiporia cocos (strain MD-104) TaxID=742152 RepID=A0A2H3ITY6_WOLCO|nr:Bromodomain-containing protein [Wolfiporia cocos MD-104 SS10]